LVGAGAGARAADHAALRTTLAVLLIGAGLALLIKAGLGIPTAALAAFPVAVAALLIGAVLRERRVKERLRESPLDAPLPSLGS